MYTTRVGITRSLHLHIAERLDVARLERLLSRAHAQLLPANAQPSQHALRVRGPVQRDALELEEADLAATTSLRKRRMMKMMNHLHPAKAPPSPGSAPACRKSAAPRARARRSSSAGCSSDTGSSSGDRSAPPDTG